MSTVLQSMMSVAPTQDKTSLCRIGIRGWIKVDFHTRAPRTKHVKQERSLKNVAPKTGHLAGNTPGRK